MNSNLLYGAAALVGGVIAYVVFGGRKFIMQGQTQFWHKSQTNALRSFLGQNRLQAESTERVWRVIPGLPAGSVSALQDVRNMQASGGVVTTSTNLLDDTPATRMVAHLTVAEFMNLKTGPTLAVLPVL